MVVIKAYTHFRLVCEITLETDTKEIISSVFIPVFVSSIIIITLTIYMFTKLYRPLKFLLRQILIVNTHIYNFCEHRNIIEIFSLQIKLEIRDKPFRI